METDSTQQKAELLQSLLTGPLSSSISKLSGSSRAIPSSEDFHFYYNFPQFKTPIKQISQTSQSLLQTIGNSTSLTKPLTFPDDPDESYDWLVDVNDQLFEKFDSSVDEFQRVRKGQEDEDGGFQLVQGKKKKAVEKELAKVSKASGGQTKVPFHIPSIRRPQDEYKIVVDNGNEAFMHVWLEKCEDGSRFIHPLEKFSELDFVDKNIGDLEPVQPPPFESTPFKLVENVEDLKELAAKLQDVNEIAVDLEHNQYRSFQGLTCLMQISTRMEDFVVDTLKLRAHIGPYLREIFKDPSKRKVMHGADRDILWLQRDFSIYVCNLFDTGQASRILQLERNSLEYLLHHFCGVTANKIYQNADWRLRPIPSEMLKYAREDTHYLLHIYDLMRVRLLTTTNNENGEALLLEVYKRSYNICMQLYEKEILTDTSYFHIYGLHGADFNSQQVAVVAGLCEWRDAVARAEDESTGFILPNKALLEIARLMPVTAGKLRQLVKFKHPYVERNLGSLVSIIKRSIENASAYESAAELIKKEHAEKVAARNMVVADESEVLPAVHTQPESLENEDGTRISEQTAEHVSTSMQVKEKQVEVSPAECGESGQLTSFDGDHMEHAKESLAVSSHTGSTDMKTDTLLSTTVREATVQVLKKPSRAFGAMLGKGSKKKLVLDQKAEIKVEQIKASVTLQFHSFPEGNEQEPHVDERTKCLGIAHPKGPVSPPAEISKLEDIISLENDSDYESPDDVPTAVNDSLEQRENGSSIPLASSDTGDKPMSLFELSSSFQSLNANRSTRRVEKSQESDILQLKPFDYEAARTEMEPGEQEEDGEIKDDDGMKGLQHSKERRRKMSTRGPGDEGTKDFPSVRRRHAFPHTGNRSFTFH